MPSVQTWNKIDRQTVTTRDNKVDHAASAKANAKEAGKNLLDMVRPQHFTDTWNDDSGSDMMMGPAMAVIAAPWLAIAEVADVVTGPVKAAKNAADAVAHKVADWF